MNIFDNMQARVTAALERLGRDGVIPTGLDTTRVVVEPPRDASHGDFATNAAMVLSKDTKMNPRALAEALVGVLKDEPGITGVEIAGPGFINIRVEPGMFLEVIRSVLDDGPTFGRSGTGRNAAVNVEYVSANPTGPMHVGHGRGAVFGDALATLLNFAGFDVTREYYINDAGAQVDVLARSAYLRYCEALGETVTIPEGLYPGDYLVPVGVHLAKEHGPALKEMAEAEWLPIVRDVSIEMMMAMIRMDLAALNIEHDVFFSERSLSQGPVDHIAKTIAGLRARDLVYEGRLPPPKGQAMEDWEDREQTLFRATQFGDDVDRPLLKSDGSYTYFASDIAYHASKFERGFATMIDIWGADHGGYVKRMNAAVKAVTHSKGELDVKLCQLVRLLRAGEPVKMSKRSGDFVTLREVVDEVGVDAVRFWMLFRKNDATLDFDLAKVLEQSKDNPVFYVQYAHARCRSVLRQAETVDATIATLEASKTAQLTLLDDSAERDLFKRIAQYPRLIDAAALAHEPHRIAFYLYDLASDFHSLWNKGKEAPHLRFVIEDNRDLSSARLAMVRSVMTVIASGLAVLGVSAPDEMR